MIEEEFNIREEYYKLSEDILSYIQNNHPFMTTFDKYVIGICGESGSGKSTTAYCLQKSLIKRNIESFILHQDNYYHLGPRQNHERRKKSPLNTIGPSELNLQRLEQHIEAFKSGQNHIVIPIVNYQKSSFSERKANFTTTDVLIVEGVYSFLLKCLDYKIFMARNYIDTKLVRRKRSREAYDPFIEKVLEIEHQKVSPLQTEADLVVQKDFSIDIAL